MTHRPLVILLTPGIGGPHAWARRLQRHLTEREVILLVRGPGGEAARHDGSFETIRDLWGIARSIGPATYMPNWLWNTYPALSRLRDRGLDARIVAHCRSDDDQSYYRPLARQAGHYDAIFSVSARCIPKLRSIRPDLGERIYHVPTFVQREYRWAPHADGMPLRLLYRGRIEDEHKRVRDLVGIAARLIDAGVDFTLTIAGNGSRVAELISDLGNVRHLGRVRLVGPIDPEDVGMLLDDHDVVLQTSAVEGLSNSLLEAMASGLVPVATAVGDTADVIDDWRNGVLVAPGDVEATASALQRLAADRALVWSMGRQAWESTYEFSWESVGPRLRRALHSVEAL